MSLSFFSFFHKLTQKIKQKVEFAITFVTLHVVYILGIGPTSIIGQILQKNFFETSKHLTGKCTNHQTAQKKCINYDYSWYFLLFS
jgi:hypothetical protein